MITYNPKDWFKLIFQFHRSDTFRILLPTMFLLGALTGGLVYFEMHEPGKWRSSTVFHQILGFVLSMLLVFRINTAYERWWEGRKLWGSLINCSRSLGVKVQAYISPVAARDSARLLHSLALFPFLLKMHLRGETPDFEGPLKDLFEKAGWRAEELGQPGRHLPLHAYTKIQERLSGIGREGKLSGEMLLLLNPEVFALMDITGACERIKNSPIPFSYGMFLKKVIFLYIVTMPLSFSLEFGYWAVPAVMLVFYAFASLELISEEVEDPFGVDANDLPLDDLSEKIRRSIQQIVQGA
jgi:putative membrane protein